MKPAQQDEMPSAPLEYELLRRAPDNSTVARLVQYADTLRAHCERLAEENKATHTVLDAAGIARGAFSHSIRYRIGELIERAESAESRLAALREEVIEQPKFRNLVDRAVKMLWLAIPETWEPVHSDSNNPIIAWVADAQEALRNG